MVPLYSRNISRPSLTTPAYLQDMPLLIDRTESTYFGIDEPSHYLSGHLAYSPIHVEDTFLDSINVMHFSYDSNSVKLWLCIHPEDYSDFNNLIYHKFKFAYDRSSQDYSGYNPICQFPAHHKRLLISPEILEPTDIRYDIVVQSPGDAVYLAPGVYHQVIDLGVDMAEAVNVGGALWGAVQRLHHNCGCPGSCHSRIGPSFRSVCKIALKRRILYSCPWRNCVSAFPRKSNLEVHQGFTRIRRLMGVKIVVSYLLLSRV